MSKLPFRAQARGLAGSPVPALPFVVELLIVLVVAPLAFVAALLTFAFFDLSRSPRPRRSQEIDR